MHRTLLFLLLLITLPTMVLAQGLHSVDLAAALERVPFTQWLNAYQQSAMTVTDFNVASVEDFIEITEFHHAFVNDGEIIHSFRTSRGDRIHCIDIATQASFVAQSRGEASPHIAPVAAALTSRNRSVPTAERFGLDGTPDTDGKLRACPAGSFPKLIPPVNNFYRFRTLDDIFQKVPAASNKEYTHEYTHAYQYANYTGEIADFNVWAPFVESSNEFSLAQLWVANGDGSNLQTVETGWQVYQGLYGNDTANLFIFYTPDGYQSGCYNLTCGAFVQTDNSVVIGGPFDQVSTINGEQVNVTIGFIRDESGDHDWWLVLDDTWVGYYPNDLFDNEGIAEYGAFVDFGGELIDRHPNGDHTATSMGSGLFPDAGYGYAAYIKKAQYINLDGEYRDADEMATQATVPECWDIGPLNNDADVDWGVNFFFGGSCGECNGCLIDNQCYLNGQPNPDNACQICDLAQSEFTWTQIPDGESCNDGLFCNGSDTCDEGDCSLHTGNPCDEDLRCDEQLNQCVDPDDSDDLIDPDQAQQSRDDEDDEGSGCGC